MTSSWQQPLQHYFGFDALRPGQQPVIEAILAGRSSAAIFPTGSGKSLCYQLPALILPHLTLVISPLLALMQDQVQFLKSRGIAAATIDSTQSRDEAQDVMNGVRSGTIKILMVSVERLKNERFRQFIAQVPISLLVVDEAHCISEWGHNFRPDYLKLPAYCREFNVPQVLLLTATATQAVIEDMQTHFALDAEDVVTTGFHRPNLRLLVQPTATSERVAQCALWLQHLARKSAQKQQDFAAIIYVTLQHTAEDVAQQLARQVPFPVRAYHAGLSHEQRDSIQQQFMSGQIPVIVATIAFGMGVDKSNIRQVMHYDLPKSIENYSQEIGRAGRDGKASDCIMLADDSGLTVLENFVYGDGPELHSIQQVIQSVAGQLEAGQWEVLMTPLSSLSNIRLLPLKTLLVNLEMRGVLTSQYSYFAEYRYKLEQTETALLSHFNGERQQFLATVLNTSNKGRSWYTLNLDALEQSLGAQASNGDRPTRVRALNALEFCQERGWLQLESKQMTDVYRVNEQALAEPGLAESLYQHFLQKQANEINRIHNMLNLFRQPDCVSRRLAAYFGERMPQDCGICSVCRGQFKEWLPTRSGASLAALDAATLVAPLQQKIQQQFGRAASLELLTRFLCGIQVPWLSKVRARQLPGFGQLEHVPYAEVSRWLESARVVPEI
ncbi:MULTISPECIES: ATP-dependent DNA helicase RecQ [unclassified Oceanobacter]|uniref:RecQ family ATP-dependent DNA helicase n=1 Tax=unclassified Oceanobacter TaxID=2620260 RepID=UPI0027338795|nr:MULTISPECIES: RecQ family ATP-dependent DNA helicase [unclassified Oceanobacter]MDP2607446.1 RecQ family ATP-dependent DNA helicase [Oceanobacter sp. 1_MG-2023]MDP2610714.1 RecQ family ATP-dependent DNA helicase [Oceanobacter sp. 2_MG-2023]